MEVTLKVFTQTALTSHAINIICAVSNTQHNTSYRYTVLSGPSGLVACRSRADVSNLNGFIEEDSSLEGLTAEEIMLISTGSVFNNAAQVRHVPK